MAVYVETQPGSLVKVREDTTATPEDRIIQLQQSGSSIRVWSLRLYVEVLQTGGQAKIRGTSIYLAVKLQWAGSSGAPTTDAPAILSIERPEDWSGYTVTVFFDFDRWVVRWNSPFSSPPNNVKLTGVSSANVTGVVYEGEDASSPFYTAYYVNFKDAGNNTVNPGEGTVLTLVIYF